MKLLAFIGLAPEIQTSLDIQWGFEIQTSLDFEWDLKSVSSTIWNPDKWPPFCLKPFEIRQTKRSGFQMVGTKALAKAQLSPTIWNQTIRNPTLKKSGFPMVRFYIFKILLLCFQIYKNEDRGQIFASFFNEAEGRDAFLSFSKSPFGKTWLSKVIKTSWGPNSRAAQAISSTVSSWHKELRETWSLSPQKNVYATKKDLSPCEQSE